MKKMSSLCILGFRQLLLRFSIMTNFFHPLPYLSPGSLVSISMGSQSKACEFRTPARPTFLMTFDKSQCDKGQLASGCVEYWCQKARKRMGR